VIGRRVARSVVLALAAASLTVGVTAASGHTVQHRAVTGHDDVTVASMQARGDAATVAGAGQAQLDRSRSRERGEPRPQILLAGLLAAAVVAALAGERRLRSARAWLRTIGAPGIRSGRAPPALLS
jgi:hypothetical protein